MAEGPWFGLTIMAVMCGGLVGWLLYMWKKGKEDEEQNSKLGYSLKSRKPWREPSLLHYFMENKARLDRDCQEISRLR